ncbi:MAG: hypothetical protein CVV64_16450 [Candidatus Wallbacteria bacterium HGW-Wallbacteria-1]|jgi:PAS domain S-box-containing protein|uniref:histidine kinase n=1 Tax=Candidatus Wallbacteria bacterium HGW-Wallbacteria-1 TaxID=2013854 RepID=A0A2N1PKV3_9BACT|nr:MAG: hypothetical protein CVV64_16450 [Candidatus Wallbacteria bacterium HGW-Wallbacteria-1]
MKKVLVFHLLAFTITVVVLLGTALNLYYGRIVDKVIRDTQLEMARNVEERVRTFDNILRITETHFASEMRERVVDASNVLSTPELRSNMTPADLKTLANSLGADDLYIINRDGVVFNTSFAPDQGFCLFSITEGFASQLKALYGKGEVFHQGWGLSTKTGKIFSYTYYSPPGSDHIIEISVNLRPYIRNRYFDGKSDYFFSDFFTSTAKNARYVRDLNIYSNYQETAWSLVHEGMSLGKIPEAMKRLRTGGQLVESSGSLMRVTKAFNFGKSAFPWANSYILEVTYDFSSIVELKSSALTFTVAAALLVTLMMITVFSKVFNSLVLNRIFRINRSISEIGKGNYSVRLDESGDDELSNIAMNVNILASGIEKSMGDLRASERRFRAIFDQAFQFIGLLDSQGTVIEFNKTALDFAGISLRDVIGLPYWETPWWTDNPDESEKLRRGLERARMGILIRFEASFICPRTGKIHNMDFSLKPILNEDGRVALIIPEARDITEKKEALREILAAKEKAERADRLKSEFLANVSHEVRTPMTSIMGYAHLLEAMNLDEKQRKYVSSILKSGNHLIDIMGDILEMARLEADSIEIRTTTFSLWELMNDCYNAIAPQIQIREQIEGKFTMQGCEGVTLHTDYVKVKQILMNLLANAVKFTEAGTIVLEAIPVRDGGIKINVRDTGIGIPEDKVELIFDKFFQVDSSSTRKFGGVGLGLAISGRYAEILGMSLSVESTSGSGSLFALTIPDTLVASGPVSSDQTSSEIKSSGNDDSRENKISGIVLVAEDNRSNFSLIQELLQSEGYTVVRASDGAEARNAYLERTADIKIVLMDINMPFFDGYEVLDFIRLRDNERGVRTPVIAVTAHASRSDMEKLESSDFDGIVIKPFAIDTILDVVKRHSAI